MRTVLVVVLAFAVVALSAAVTLLGLEQRKQGRELARLTECVSTLERNQSSPPSTPEGEGLVMGCPLYN